jgi:hypothetical protein
MEDRVMETQTISTMPCATENCENRVPRDSVAPDICRECRDRLMEEAALNEEFDDEPVDPVWVEVLCGCGWGQLKVSLDDAPEHCPLCGYCFQPDDTF